MVMDFLESPEVVGTQITKYGFGAQIRIVIPKDPHFYNVKRPLRYSLKRIRSITPPSLRRRSRSYTSPILEGTASIGDRFFRGRDFSLNFFEYNPERIYDATVNLLESSNLDPEAAEKLSDCLESSRHNPGVLKKFITTRIKNRTVFLRGEDRLRYFNTIRRITNAVKLRYLTTILAESIPHSSVSRPVPSTIEDDLNDVYVLHIAASRDNVRDGLFDMNRFVNLSMCLDNRRFFR